MAIEKIEWNDAGFKAIVNCENAQKLIDDYASGVEARANANAPAGSKGFKKETIKGYYAGGRWVAFVSSQDRSAAKAESEDKVLSKAVT